MKWVKNEDVREKLRSIRCFLLDMDGTFYLGNRLIDGSLEFLEALRKTGRTARFLTNNSSRSAAAYARKLERLGVPEEYRDVISSAHAAAHYCMKKYPGGRCFLMGNPDLREELAGMGMNLQDENPDYVLLAFDTTLAYDRLCVLCDHIRAGLPYIATHPDFNCPTETGFVPDIGSFMALIEASTGRRPDAILGKPYSGIVEEAVERTGFAKQEMAVVGDRLYTDVATGVNHGLTGILVLSGEAGPEDLETSDVQPDLVFERLSDMIRYL